MFKDVQVFLHGILREAAVADTSWPQFHSALQRGRFLFGADVNAYLEDIRIHAGELGAAISQLQRPLDHEQRSRQIEMKHEHLKWLTKQLTEMFDKFEPYLGFSKHK